MKPILFNTEMVYKDDTEQYESYLLDQGMTDEEVEAHIKNIDWIKAIAVDIDLPDKPTE